MAASDNEQDPQTRMDSRADEPLSDINEREVRKLVLTQGGLPAREWLVKERGYSPERAKAIVDPFLDEAVAMDVPAWDFIFALLWLGGGVCVAFFAFTVGTSGYLFFVSVAIATFFLLRGLWKTGRYILTVRR